MEKRLVIGWFFLLLGLTPVLTFLLWGNPQYVVWFSNHTFIILGLALLFRSAFWVFAELCLGFVPELVWSFDFLVNLFTGVSPLNITGYMFKNGAFDWLHLYSLQHLLFVPACFYALCLLKGPVENAWRGSVLHGFIMWPLSFLFGPDYNINCVFYKCTFDLPFYVWSWPLFILVHVGLVYFFVIKLWKKKKKRK